MSNRLIFNKRIMTACFKYYKPVLYNMPLSNKPKPKINSFLIGGSMLSVLACMGIMMTEQQDDVLKRWLIAEAKGNIFETGYENLDQVISVNLESAANCKYDTVIDTFGLCSCDDPIEALVQLAGSCKSSNESKILLLEHGRSYYAWLNALLDSHADSYLEESGCRWNRDILSLLQDHKVQQNLEIIKISRWHFGTTYFIIAKPKKLMA